MIKLEEKPYKEYEYLGTLYDEYENLENKIKEKYKGYILFPENIYYYEYDLDCHIVHFYKDK